MAPMPESRSTSAAGCIWRNRDSARISERVLMTGPLAGRLHSHHSKIANAVVAREFGEENPHFWQKSPEMGHSSQQSLICDADAYSRGAQGRLSRSGSRALSRLVAGGSGLVIFGVLIDGPDIVEALACKNIFRSQQGGHHRMVLVVVLVHAIAADKMQGGESALENEANRVHVLLVPVVVNGISLALADDASVNHVSGVRKVNALDFFFRQRDQFGVWRGPQAVVLEAEVFQAVGAEGGVGNHFRRPRFVILHPSDLYRGI